jgi:hypothetical protein
MAKHLAVSLERPDVEHVPQRHRHAAAAALSTWRDQMDLPDGSQHFGEGLNAGGLDAVVVGEQDVVGIRLAARRLREKRDQRNNRQKDPAAYRSEDHVLLRFTSGRPTAQDSAAHHHAHPKGRLQDD